MTFYQCDVHSRASNVAAIYLTASDNFLLIENKKKQTKTLYLPAIVFELLAIQKI